MKWVAIVCIGLASLCAEESFVHSHGEFKEYSMNGNTLKGLATKSLGATEFEIWHSSIAVGSSTPRHTHDSEEVFVILKGKMLAIIGDQEIECVAPATLICPANIPHQLVNIGDEPTDHFLVLGIDSKIVDLQGNEMKLPWRE